MYRLKQIVEVLYQGRWIQASIVSEPEGENDECYIVNCGLAQFIARHAEEEIRPVRKFHVMTAAAGAGEYRRGILLEEFYAFDSRLALKIAKQYWPGQKAALYCVIPEEGIYEFAGNVDDNKKKKE